VKIRRLALLCAASGALCVTAAAPAGAQDPAPTPAPAPTATPAPDERRIAPGITAGGIDVGGLTVTEASAKLEQLLGAKVRRDVVLKTAGRTFRLDAETAKLAFDTVTSAKRALYAKAPDAAAGGGQAAGTDVPLAITSSTLAIRSWAQGVASSVARAPRNAELRIGLRKLDVRASKKGRRLDWKGTEKLVKGVLGDARTSRVLKQNVSAVTPAVTYKTLQRQYGTVVTVSKSEFKLRVFKRLRFSKSYGVAIGQPAYPTPSGRFAIQNKQVNPTWSVPNSPWAGELAGTTVQGGTAANPLKARWMGIVNGVGIHGTGEEYSIGSRASHGCIRMRVADVIDLYPRIPVGTTVVIR
jgi:lipoprotein-anchoring transpeptidase ErfK/SrfK